MIKSSSSVRGSWNYSLWTVLVLFISRAATQIHVGSLCHKHEDCIRYCAYSKHGLESAACCLPEKIRLSRSNWAKTGSSTCYCCPLPESIFQEKRASSSSNNSIPISSQGRITNDNDFVLGGTNHCDRFLLSGYEVAEVEGTKFIEEEQEILETNNSDVTQEFCTSRCVQVMINMKVGFEFPSLCRARGNKNNHQSNSK